MGKLENISIFNDTITQINNNIDLLNKTELSKKHSVIYDDTHEFKLPDNKLKGNIFVKNQRSLQNVQNYDNIAVLNFASATNPGGGVLTGSSAQEESICRITNLFPCLNQNKFKNNFYNYHRKLKNTLYTNKAIYTPNIMVIKKDKEHPENLSEKNWYAANIITCAAPNLREVKISEKDLLLLHKSRIKHILNIAIENGNTNIVLGAFGCGAFKNPPHIVARAFKEILIDENYRYYFDNVFFSIITTINNKENLTVFERTFKKYQQ